MNPIQTEVVLEIDGRRLVSGRRDDFIRDPVRGGHYFYEGNLYEVVDVIETIGAPQSKLGSILAELLNVLYPDPRQAASMLAGMQRVSEPVTPEKVVAPGADGLVSGSSLSLIALAQKERLQFLRLKLVHRASNMWQQLLERDGAARVALTGEAATKAAE